MDSLKKLQAKVTQLKQSATNLTHKKSLSTSSKQSRDKAVRPSRSMPLDPVSLEPEVWTSHPRAQYRGKTPLKPSDIRVITRPEDQKIPPPYAPLMVRDVQPEEEEYSDEDWYPGPTPPPKDIVFQFPIPPKTAPKRRAKQTTKQGTSSSSSTAGKQKPVPVPVPVPVAVAVSVPAPTTPSPTPSTPPSSSRLPKPVDSPLRKEDLLPPPPKAMFEKMQRQAEARRPKNLFGPLQAAPSYEEIADFVMRSDPSPRSGSPGAISSETELGRDRLREAIRRRKAQYHSGGSGGGSSSSSNHNRPGHLPTPSASSTGSSGAINVGVLPTTAPLEIRRTRSTGASNALSPPPSSAPQAQARKGTMESSSSLPQQQQQQRRFGIEDAHMMTRNYFDPTAATLVALRQLHDDDEDEYGEQDNSDENIRIPELQFGPLSTLNRLPISPPASPPPSNYSSPTKGAMNSGRATPSSLASNERIRLKEVRYYQHGGPSSRPESPLSLNLQQRQQVAHSSNHSRQWSDGPRYKLDASTSSIVLDTSNTSMGSLSAGLGPGSGFGIGMGIEQSDSQATAMSRRSSSNGSRSNHNSNSNGRSGGSAAGSRPALAIGKQQAQQFEQLRHRHYPTPSNSSASASSFCSGNINNPNRSTSSDSAFSPVSCYPPSPPPKKPRQLQGSGSGSSGKGIGSQAMSSTYKSAVPAIGFMSPADRVVNANVVTPPSSNQGHGHAQGLGLGLRRANTATGPGPKERLPVTPRRF